MDKAGIKEMIGVVKEMQMTLDKNIREAKAYIQASTSEFPKLPGMDNNKPIDLIETSPLKEVRDELQTPSTDRRSPADFLEKDPLKKERSMGGKQGKHLVFKV